MVNEKFTFRPSRYNAIKQFTCVENAIPSQVVTVKTLTKKRGSMLMSVCTKLVMQMNCKMGGALWRVNIPLRDTMILGFDTFHDSVNKKRQAFINFLF
jgi:aubergine-like protein